MSEPLDFGEPWTTDEYAMYAWDRGGRTMGDDNEACFRARGAGRGASVAEQQTAINRVVACVNACAGMADPQAEIVALRERAEKAERELAETKLEWARSVDAAAATRKALQADLDAALKWIKEQSLFLHEKFAEDRPILALLEKRRESRG